VQNLANRFISRNSARGDQGARLTVPVAKYCQAAAKPICNYVYYALLERGAEVANILVSKGCDPFSLKSEGRFQA
jgi:hypothetical protein